MSTPQRPADDRLTISDLWEITRLPIFLATLAIALTWLVWYLTTVPCTSELANIIACNPGRIARYINLDVLGNLFTHATLAAGSGGFWSYLMITKERRARQAAEMRLAEALEQSAADREREAAERAADREREAAERAADRAQFAEERAQFAAERAQFAADREREAAERAAEREREAAERAAERAQAAEERRLFLAAIERLTAQRNGSSSPDSQ